MNEYNIISHAKVNLFLHVTEKRADGYHNLFSLMCRISLHDTVFFNFNTDRISVSCSHPDVPENNKNLAYGAAEVFFQSLGIDHGTLASPQPREYKMLSRFKFFGSQLTQC